MKIRPIGPFSVKALGLGCLGMSADHYYGARSEAESLATIERALELGVTLLDTADSYGPYSGEELLRRAIRGKRDRVVLSTKCGLPREKGERVNGTPRYIREACEGSLKRLGVETLDLYHLHRVDPRTPIEESVGALADLVKAGKVRAIGLSEVSSATLRRANTVHKIASVQSEYSLWSRDPEGDVLAACADLGVAFIACCPLGRGFLTGKIRGPEDLSPNDVRRFFPRFEADHIAKNLWIPAEVQRLAAGLGITASQLALAWLLARHDFVIPCPGAKTRAHLEENCAAMDLVLRAEVVEQLCMAFPLDCAAGTRYEPVLLKQMIAFS